MRTAEVTVLLVEDNEVDVQAIRRAFKKKRIANPIRVAEDGICALEMLRDEENPFPRPFIILLDLNMPRMNGIEFLKELRADKVLNTAIVFVLTTSTSDEDKFKSYGQHVAGYIIKNQVGEDFIRFVDMLGQYWKVVAFLEDS